MVEDMLREMKLRELNSYRWQEDVIKPLAKEFNIDSDNLNEIFVEKLDMSQIDALHATFESSKHEAIYQKLYVDFHFHWFIDVLNMVTIEDANKIILPLAKKILRNKLSYSDALIEGRNDLIKLLGGL